MATDKEISTFLEYLKANNLEAKFITQFNTRLLPALSMTDKMRFIHPNDLMNGMFWSETREGYEFWDDANKNYQFSRYYEEINSSMHNFVGRIFTDDTLDALTEYISKGYRVMIKDEGNSDYKRVIFLDPIPLDVKVDVNIPTPDDIKNRRIRCGVRLPGQVHDVNIKGGIEK